MIPFLMQLTLPHMLLAMLTIYLYQELEPPQQKSFYFVVHKFGTRLIPHFILQGHWLILNCYINHFHICNYVYNSCTFVCQGTAEKQYCYTEQSSL